MNKIGFKIRLEIATTNIPMLKLFNQSHWKNKHLVKTVIYITQFKNESVSQKSHTFRNLESLLQEIQQEEGKVLVKKMCAKKFYFLFDQMTELIPLFAYLERLDALKFIMS